MAPVLTLDGRTAIRVAGRPYTAAAGRACLDEESLRQLIRARIRREMAYDRAVKPVPDAEDVAYQRQRRAVFHALRPTPPELWAVTDAQ